MGGCAILNGTRDPILWGYKNRINDFEFARGYGHKISNSIFISAEITVFFEWF